MTFPRRNDPVSQLARITVFRFSYRVSLFHKQCLDGTVNQTTSASYSVLVWSRMSPQDLAVSLTTTSRKTFTFNKMELSYRKPTLHTTRLSVSVWDSRWFARTVKRDVYFAFILSILCRKRETVYQCLSHFVSEEIFKNESK